MGALYPSVSPRNCRCTQWVGVASSTTENKYSLSQMTDISFQRDESLPCLPAPLCVCLMSRWRGQRGKPLHTVSHELLQRRLVFSTLLIFRDGTSDLC